MLKGMAAAKNKVPGAAWVVGAGWLIAVVSVTCYGLAKPAEMSMFDRMIDTGRTAPQWNLGLLRVALVSNITAIIIGLVGAVLTAGRRGRRDFVMLAGLLVALSAMGLAFIVPKITG